MRKSILYFLAAVLTLMLAREKNSSSDFLIDGAEQVGSTNE